MKARNVHPWACSIEPWLIELGCWTKVEAKVGMLDKGARAEVRKILTWVGENVGEMWCIGSY